MWVSILVSLFLAETADTSAPECLWWTRADEDLFDVPRVSPSSGVLLPLQPPRSFNSPYEWASPRLAPEDLSAVASDVEGRAYAGRVRWEDPFPEVQAEGFPHQLEVWWEPNEPLPAGRYTLDIAVGPPPQRGACSNLAYEPTATAFALRTSFEVALGAPAAPTITFDAHLAVSEDTAWQVGTARVCPSGGQSCERCAAHPEVACFDTSPNARRLTGQVTLAALERAPLHYYVFNVSGPGLGHGDRTYSLWGSLPGETHVSFSESVDVVDPTLEFELYAFVTRGRIAFASAKLPIQSRPEPWPSCPAEACAACAAAAGDCGPVPPPWVQADPDPHLEGDGKAGCQGGDPSNAGLVGLSVWGLVCVARRRARAR